MSMLSKRSIRRNGTRYFVSFSPIDHSRLANVITRFAISPVGSRVASRHRPSPRYPVSSSFFPFSFFSFFFPRGHRNTPRPSRAVSRSSSGRGTRDSRGIITIAIPPGARRVVSTANIRVTHRRPDRRIIFSALPQFICTSFTGAARRALPRGQPDRSASLPAVPALAVARAARKIYIRAVSG